SLLALLREAGFSGSGKKEEKTVENAVAEAMEDAAPEGHGSVALHCKDATWVLAWADEQAGGRRLFVLHRLEDSDAEHRYELLKRELQVIINSMHDGIWIIDGDGLTVHVNKAMKRIADIEPEEMIGKHVTDPIRDGAFTSAVTLMALEERKPITMFDDYACGTRCLNTSTPVFDDEGNIWRVVASIRDMTELEALQKRLVEAEMAAHAYRGQLASMQQSKTQGFIANSKVMRDCVRELEKAAKAPSGILILGETGTGKTLAASNIHRKSPRADAPFISVNCAAIPQTLIESELFGYEKGAFTGAGNAGKKGFFELADKGTLLLDEVGELPLNMQAKLLHVFDNQVFHKIGGEKSIKVDVRIIAATNRPLEQLVADGEFRADLYYRLRVLSVEIPPLRKRPEDIPELAMYFLDQACKRHGTIRTLSPKVLRCFAAHSWPGNVRELRAAVEFLAAMTESSIIRLSDVPPHIVGGQKEFFQDAADEAPLDLRGAVSALERSMIRDALARSGSTHKAAKLLGISQSSVVRKARQLGIKVVE
ncbi:MAG: sigma 54-interacting transcriptional regulator, partial [Desulfovibrio sp.]|nr:sigma 54-interacting transcriptional regulator [Desulfovibrio sp.]